MRQHRGHFVQALLMDYITPTSLKALPRAIKARHFLVAVTLLATVALQLVTVLSTALFDIEYLSVRKYENILRLDTISGLSHDFSAIDASPVLTLYGIQNTGLNFPEGTTSFHAVPKLFYSRGESNPSKNSLLNLDLI